MKKLLTILIIFLASVCQAQFLRAQSLTTKQSQQVKDLITAAISPLKTQISDQAKLIIVQQKSIDSLKLVANDIKKYIDSRDSTLRDDYMRIIGNLPVTTFRFRGGVKVDSIGQEKIITVQGYYDVTCKCFKPFYQ